VSARAGPVVFKFGGTSLATAAHLRSVAKLISAEPAPPVVVVSAMAGLTDQLEGLADGIVDREAGVASVRVMAESMISELGGDPTDLSDTDLEGVANTLSSAEAGPLPPAERDRICALGEEISTLLMVLALKASGTPARRVDSRKVIRTDTAFGSAQPSEAAIHSLARAHLLPISSAGEVAVMQGFVGAAADGRTTTLGRGGSDLTAVLLGSALDSEMVHIWTDVEGILSGDPRYVTHPRVLPVVGFEEVVELAYFGAKVLHSVAAMYAVARRVPVRIRSTFSPLKGSTLILPERKGGAGIAAVVFKPNVAMMKVRSRPSALPYGFLARVFGILARHRLPVDLVATSHTSTALTLDEGEELEEVTLELEEVDDVELVSGLATVTVVGHGLLREPGLNARVFQTVGLTPVYLISQASDVSLSFVVEAAEAPRLTARLHKELLEKSPESEEEARTTLPSRDKTMETE
jgi:aspartate kinase